MKTRIVLALLVAIALAALLTLNRRPEPTTASNLISLSAPATNVAKSSNPVSLAAPGVETEPERRARMVSAKANRDDFKLSEQDVYLYLEANRSNAVSLMGAYEATGSKEYLKIAAARFPNDPMVQAKVLIHDALPEERQKWIDALKKSAPENFFPHLLAAQEAMKTGDVKAGLSELAAGRGKAFDDYTRESQQSLEEAYLSAGRSIAESKILGSAEVSLPHLAPLKSVGGQFLEAAEKAGQAGDSATQLELLKANWEIGNQFRGSKQQGILLTDTIGLVMENNTLKAWPANVPAPFLERAPVESLAANQAYREELKRGGPLFDRWFPTAPESEIISYMDRSKSFGELEAIHWLRERHPELAQSGP